MFKSIKWICLCFILFFFCIKLPVQADTIDVEINTNGDNFIKQTHADENEGPTTYVKIQSSNVSRILARFSTDDIIAATEGNPVVSARLEFYLETNWLNWGSGATLNLHRINVDWTEMGSTWNCPNDTDLSNTTPDCPIQWNGGDYVTTPSATIFETNSSIGPQVFDVTADVQSILNGGNNYGWLLKKMNETDPGRRIMLLFKEPLNIVLN